MMIRVGRDGKAKSEKRNHERRERREKGEGPGASISLVGATPASRFPGPAAAGAPLLHQKAKSLTAKDAEGAKREKTGGLDYPCRRDAPVEIVHPLTAGRRSYRWRFHRHLFVLSRISRLSWLPLLILLFPIPYSLFPR